MVIIMMDDSTPIIFLLAGVIIAALIFFPWEQMDQRDEVGVPTEEGLFDLSLDRDVYHSGDGMEMNVSVPPEGANITLRVRGVKDSRDRFRISEEREITPSQEGRIVTLRFRLPSCYGCAGISPGNYSVSCEISEGETVLHNATKTIELRK